MKAAPILGFGVVALLAGCSAVPDCDADVTQSRLSAELVAKLREKFGERLKVPLAESGVLDLNPRTLARDAREQPVRVTFEQIAEQSHTGEARQCRATVQVRVKDFKQKVIVDRTENLGFAVTPLPPGFAVKVNEADLKKWTE